ncbi:hypothetical protein CEP54_001656 [Fusarium duplospermum]|uniref:Major facilitator superfamily (MFS) profile domain-containing protein n=1 Tax=Fusarium duplospermum TaxID=1325734 RepID=A0A428R0B0_9HYPO|nr:hypothetical protein CEP54_001656 [Fusarium duplospermum]
MDDELLPEEECRAEDVQQELNTIVMGILISVTVSGALVAFPLGILADRVGRVPILSLSILSMLLSQAYAMIVCWQWKKIPVEALWGLGVPLLLGGGRSVAEAMVFAIIADVVPDKKSEIASSLARVHSSSSLGSQIATLRAFHVSVPTRAYAAMPDDATCPTVSSLAICPGAAFFFVFLAFDSIADLQLAVLR